MFSCMSEPPYQLANSESTGETALVHTVSPVPSLVVYAIMYHFHSSDSIYYVFFLEAKEEINMLEIV